MFELQRMDLLGLISDYSESHWAAGWMSGIEREIALKGDYTIFSFIGKAIGWPIGYNAEEGWETWEQAVYRAHKARTEYMPKSIAHIEANPKNPLFPDRPMTTDHLKEQLEESKRIVAEYEASLTDGQDNKSVKEKKA